MMSTDQGRGNREEHWVGSEVSKGTFNDPLALSNQRFPSTPLWALPWKAFPRRRAGVATFLKSGRDWPIGVETRGEMLKYGFSPKVSG